jgi:formamidopyrimidine-DNA glycosylase
LYRTNMPELPEVQTTVNGLRKHVIGLRIKEVWTNYNSAYYRGSDTIKDPVYFKHFKKEVVGRKIVSAERRAKNILINLEGGYTILVHMKMTGHLLYGIYKFNPSTKTEIKKDPWQPVAPESLKDPFNRRVRLIFSLSNGKHLALSDMRRFAKVTLLPTNIAHDSAHLMGIGPEPLEKSFTFDIFRSRLLLKPNGKIKQVLLDQAVIAGIGNIYSDESLWRAGIHPLEQVHNIKPAKMQELYEAIQSTLSKGIDFGGDSMSDYRNINGEKGKFQEQHSAYRRAGKKCLKKGCKGIINRIVVGGRGTHFCPVHQKLKN